MKMALQHPPRVKLRPLLVTYPFFCVGVPKDLYIIAPPSLITIRKSNIKSRGSSYLALALVSLISTRSRIPSVDWLASSATISNLISTVSFGKEARKTK